MKISYNVLKKYIPNIKSVEEVCRDLTMHTAEIEWVELEWSNLENIFVWEVLTCKKHPDSKKLNCTTVKVWKNIYPIVCWASNIKVGIKVPVAICWAKLKENFIIKKVKIRWEISEWMICSKDELWLCEDIQEGILELNNNAKSGVCIRKYLKKDDIFLEINNKAINHRPDLFSYIWIIRELFVINWGNFDFKYKKKNFSWKNNLWIKNKIPDIVKRYIWIKVNNVSNIKSPEYIKEVLNSFNISSKWLLIDITNYCLYLYWQPTHCFDADKIKWKIVIRYAKQWEYFKSLKNIEYNLSKEDIVIADDESILALWWVIWWKNSATSSNTKNIIIESAHFNQSIVRKTWKKYWIRTDSLNVFEKDILPEMSIYGASLIIYEIEKNLKWSEIVAFSDSYKNKQKNINIAFDLKFIKKLIWKNYNQDNVLFILNNLWIKLKKWQLKVPFWRKDLNYKADIAEEIARIDWYDKIKATIPDINLWAVIQSNIYKLKNDTRNYFTNNWWYDMYTYSFLNKNLMSKVLWNIDDLIPIKNALSEDLTHLRWSLIPNLLLSLQKNIKQFNNMSLFELEKVFKKEKSNIKEFYSLSWINTSTQEIAYYNIQNTLSDFFKTIWIFDFSFDKCNDIPSFAHKWRTANIIVRWQIVWTIWEIKQKVVNNFNIESRLSYFEINISLIKNALYKIVKIKDISNFQENNFELNFVVNKNIKASEIKKTIEKADQNLIIKVELIDIYENEKKLLWKRSLIYKIYIQSLKETLDDSVKNNLINEIVDRVQKKWWKLR